MTLLTRKEAAAHLGISVELLDQERRAGRIAYIQRKPGCKVWITEEAIAEVSSANHAPGQTGSAVGSGFLPTASLSHNNVRKLSLQRKVPQKVFSVTKRI